MLGTTLGNYRLERELGRGGMGAVYVGTHALLGREAAIKVLLAKYSQDQDIVQRFFNEARAATAIEHPGIVEIYDYGKDASGCAFIVMELCQGESLGARIRRRHRFTVAEALTITRQIAGTLGAAHKAGIVHRDLKPDNVFVVPDPEVAGGERIKLLDFGIAKLATDTAGPMKTTTGVIMGTPNYMSPEQCRGAGQVDHRSDLYSLGCMLFELMCGRVPFVGEGSGDIIGAHLLTAPPKPSAFAPTIPAEIEQLILRLLAKKPAERPEHADLVIVELVRIADALPEGLETTQLRHDVALEPTSTPEAMVDVAAATAASIPPIAATALGHASPAPSAPTNASATAQESLTDVSDAAHAATAVGHTTAPKASDNRRANDRRASSDDRRNQNRNPSIAPIKPITEGDPAPTPAPLKPTTDLDPALIKQSTEPAPNTSADQPTPLEPTTNIEPAPITPTAEDNPDPTPIKPITEDDPAPTPAPLKPTTDLDPAPISTPIKPTDEPVLSKPTTEADPARLEPTTDGPAPIKPTIDVQPALFKVITDLALVLRTPTTGPSPTQSTSDPAPIKSTDVDRSKPRRSRIVRAAIIAASIALVGTILYVATRSESEPAPAVVDTSRMRLVVGEVTGDDASPAVRLRVRAHVFAILATHAQDFQLVLIPGPDDEAAGRLGRAIKLGYQVTRLESSPGSVRCQYTVVVSRFPAGTITGSANGGGSVVGIGSSVRDIDGAAEECLSAALENRVTQILPALRSGALSPAPVTAPTTPPAPPKPRRVYEVIGDPIVSSATATPADGPPSEPTSPLDNATLKATIHAYRVPIERCYIKRLEKDPTLTTTVKIKFGVETDGRSRTLQPLEGDEELGKCIAGMIFARIGFPKPDADVDVVFVNAFRPRSRSR